MNGVQNINSAGPFRATNTTSNIKHSGSLKLQLRYVLGGVNDRRGVNYKISFNEDRQNQSWCIVADWKEKKEDKEDKGEEEEEKEEDAEKVATGLCLRRSDPVGESIFGRGGCYCELYITGVRAPAPLKRFGAPLSGVRAPSEAVWVSFWVDRRQA